MEGCMGEESFQMWELNRRLEAYLARVKALEEQNELLSAELGGLRAQAGDSSWRARADDELAALRALVDQRWREKHAAEVARDNLAEELEGVAGRCQQLRLARERTAEEAARSRRAVEAEKCARGWLTNQAAELERELEALRAAHEEERASLNAQAACAPRGPAPPRAPPAPAPEVEELAQRLGEAWRGAVRGYQERVAHMETSLGQARERLGRAVQGARESRLELQQLQAERGGLQERRAALEQRLEGRWQERLRATENFQLAVEALEQEKQGLQSQIAQVLEGRQQLAHLKMSLSLEVATYRTLLEAENSRLQTPGCRAKASLGFQDPKLDLRFPGTPEGRRLGPSLPVLSPTPLPSPLPDTLETPVPAFLKSQEFLQPRAPTLASTPIPPTPQPPIAASDVELRAQDAPVSLLPPQGGRQQAAEPLWAEAKVAVPASILPGPEEPGGEQREATSGQAPEDPGPLAPPLSPDHPSPEAKDREPSGSRASSLAQEEGEGQIDGLVEEAAAVEVRVVSQVQQAAQPAGDLDVEETEDSQGPLGEETQEALGEEIPQPLMSPGDQHQEAPEENQELLGSLGEESSGTLASVETENEEPLQPVEEKDVEVARPLGGEAPELREPGGREDPRAPQSLEEERQEWGVPLAGGPETFPGKEDGETVTSPEEEAAESLGAPEEENPELHGSQEGGDPEPQRPLGEESRGSLGSSEEEDLEALRPPQKENQEPPTPAEEEEQETAPPAAEVDLEPLGSPGKDQEGVSPPGRGRELAKSSEEDNAGAVRAAGAEDLGPLTSAEGDLEILKSLEMQEPQWCLEEVDRGMTPPLGEEIQERSGSLEENQEPLQALEEEEDEGGHRDAAEEEDEEQSPWCLGEQRQELPRPADQHTGEEEEEVEEEEEEGSQGLGQEHPGKAARASEEEAELDPRQPDGCAGKEEEAVQGELQLGARGTAWGPPGSPEPREQGVPAVGASEKEGAEGLQEPERQPEQPGAPDLRAPQGVPEATEPLSEGEAAAPEGDPVSPGVTLASETAVGEAAVGAVEDPGHLAREVMQPLCGEGGLEVRRVQGLEGPREDPEEADVSEVEPPKAEPPQPPAGREASEPETPWGAGEGSPAETPGHTGGEAPECRPLGSEADEDDSQLVLGAPSPRPPEPRSPTPTLGGAPEPQPQAEGSQEVSFGLEGRVEATGQVEGEQEELGSGEIPEGLQEEGEESREESEADELGETLPDSTPLGLYLGSPASPRWDRAGEQRPSPQGYAPEEGWDPAGLASQSLGAPPPAEEEGEGDEECDRDSELSEEFEDLGTEASLLPGAPRQAAEPLGQVPQLLEPAAWDRDGESDGFADEEESGEEGEEEEEEREPGAGQWGPGSSAGSLQRGDFLESETVGVSVPWDDGSRAAVADAPVTALETESQDSAKPSGSEEEFDSVPLEREDQGPGPVETPRRAEGTSPGTADTLGINGRGPDLEESEHVNGGVVNGLQQPEEVGQGKLGAPDGDRGSPLAEEEGAALKTPWAGVPFQLGPSPFLKFMQREGEGDSWSSGED
nr:nestin [Oryctolagus cuniculus]